MSLTAYTPGNIPTYRFYVTTFNPTLTKEVFPLNFLSTSIVYEKEPGQVFYRAKFNGSLLFGTNSETIDDSGNIVNRVDDWDLFWFIEGLDDCFRLDLLITRTIRGVTSDYWTGYFSTDQGKFDIDRCLFEVTPIVSDDYSIFLDKKDVEYNIIDIPGGDAPEITTEVTLGVTTYTYTHNRFVLDIIEYIIDDILPGTIVTSTFLTEVNNPVTLDDNRFLYLTIASKFDIKMESLSPASTETETVAMLSFQSLMEILKCMNLYWDYTPFEIRIEHISFWDGPGTGIDLRDHSLAIASNKYSYTQESMPKYEKFKWTEADSDFLAYDIWYDSTCVNQDPGSNINEISINATTDIEYIIECMADADLNSLIDDDGFVLLANREDGGNYYVQIAETGGNGTYPVMYNGDLSWRSLHEYYFRHDRVLITGYLNLVLTDFYTAKKTKKQDVSIILCEEFDPQEEIVSELGETYLGGVYGSVSKSDLSPSGLMKLSLLYGPPGNDNTGNPSTRAIRCVEVNSGANQATYYLTFSHAADAALVADPPQIRLICQRTADMSNCDTGYQTFVVNLGDWTSSLVVNFCNTGTGLADCILIRHDDQLKGGWDIATPILTDETCDC